MLDSQEREEVSGIEDLDMDAFSGAAEPEAVADVDAIDDASDDILGNETSI